MLRKLLLAAFIVCVTAVAAMPVMRDEPKEFRGISFGKVYEPGHEFVCQTDSEEGVRCTRAKDELQYEGVPIKSLEYLFMYKQLYTVDMSVSGKAAYDKLASILVKKHGEPAKLLDGMLSFEGSQVDILMFFDEKRSTGELSLVFKNLPCPVE